MKNENNFMTPISKLFILIAISPYIGLKFGNISLLAMSTFVLYAVFNAYQFYKERASEKNISYVKALQEDLPDMSPIHFIFFILIAAPLLLMITGGEIQALVGIGIVWTMYAIYYYGFREK